MKRVFNFVMRQYDLGSWWGAWRSLWGSAMFYYSPVSMFMTFNIYYYAVRDKYLAQMLPWFNLKWFILFAIIAIFMAMLLEYKFTAPSAIRYASGQATKHKNPLYDKILVIEKQNIDLANRLEGIEKMLREKDGKQNKASV